MATQVQHDTTQLTDTMLAAVWEYSTDGMTPNDVINLINQQINRGDLVLTGTYAEDD